MAVEATGRDERDQLASGRGHRGEDVDQLPNKLGRRVGPHAGRGPTPMGPSDAAKAAFILRQDQHRAVVVGFSRRDCRLNLGWKVFFNWA
jgi:hypothetical protein